MLTVAVDGPASSGKSTVSKRIAEDLNLVYIDTGAMYRALTLAAIRAGVSLDDSEKLTNLLNQLEITFKSGKDNQQVYINQENVTSAIRSREVTNNVSEVSSHATVRQALVNQQRHLAEAKDVIMDGRDIGTVVLPDATVKIFLVASVEERAMRRYKENKAAGREIPLQMLRKELRLRDEKDSKRKESPLKQADDAIQLDTTGLTIDEVVSCIESIIQKNM